MVLIAVIVKGEQQFQPIRGTKSREEYQEAITKAIKEKASTLTIADEDGDLHVFVVSEIKGAVVQNIGS
jgi:uncharacterized protein YnzC (UPF0291/DUF896 family)